MARRKVADQRGKGLDLWDPPADAGDAVVCIATTYTFDATFFEMECLSRFLQMTSHPLESESVGYLIEREEKLRIAKVAVLADRRHARDKESLRWDVLGVLVPGGAQHAKVSLLLWSNHLRVIVASGNLSDPAYRKNLEIFGTFEYSRKLGGAREQILRCIEFLEVIVEAAVGSVEPETPKFRAKEALSSARSWLAQFPPEPESGGVSTPLFGYPNDGVLTALSAQWDGAPARRLSIISPFFDGEGNERRTIAAVISLLAKRRPREVEFSFRSCLEPDSTLRLFAPQAVVELASESCDVTVYAIPDKQDEENRFMHAKVLALEGEQLLLLLAGSSNFTVNGLLGGNFEANILYRAKASDPRFSMLSKIHPFREKINHTEQPILWDSSAANSEEGDREVALPAGFQDAIFVPSPEPQLKLFISGALPNEWTITVPSEGVLLSSDSFISQPYQLFPWADKPVPFLLDVSWRDSDRQFSASWPVNVSNPATLAPPDKLKDLTLDQFLEILSSTRPLPEAVVQALEKRGHGRFKTTLELDPLKRFDSNDALLRRTKRVSKALEGLVERLERPATTIDQLDWRLGGIVGPLALAGAFVRDAKLPGEAKFYLAELALSLRRVNPQKIATITLAAAAASERISEAICTIHGQAIELPPLEDTEMLETYIFSAFEKALSR
jgi:hypothetical protein